MTAPDLQNVADIYRLTPLQEGLLFHSVAEPGTGLYVDQVSARLEGDFDPPRFRAVWQRLVERHPALRTAFLWDGLDEPLQVVRETVTLPWTEEDWRHLDCRSQNERRAALLRRDRARGFTLEQVPLLRLTMARTGERSWWWLLTFHHLIADGWSTAVLLREAFRAYAASGPDGAALDHAPPYRDYVAWHAGRSLAEAEGFWRGELRGFTEPLRLGSLPFRPDRRTGERQQETQLSAETTAALRAFAAGNGLTLNTVVQGAWALLLSRLLRQRDVVFGITTSGRPPEIEGIERAVGLFINTLPLRVDVDPEAALVPWLKAIQQRQLAVRRFEFSPLAAVQRWSEVADGQALFESILVFENYPESDALVPEGGAIEVHDLRFDEQSNYPLALLCVPARQLRLIAIRDPGRIGDELASLCLKLLGRILDGFIANQEGRLREIRLADAADMAALGTWNATGTDPLEPVCMHHLIERAAGTYADRIAVVGPDESLTYAELDARANALAARLRAMGIKRNDPVGLIADPSSAMPVGILGIMKAGGAYVPLDPAYPPGLMRHVLSDTGAGVVVLGDETLADRFRDLPVALVAIEADPPPAVPGPPLDSAPADLAYVLYTSGTSGRPKGVPITHRNLVHSTEARGQVYGETPDAFLLLSSFTFDSSIAGIFWTLASGGRLVLPRRRLEQDLDALLALVRDHRVTHTLCLPSLYALILREAAPADLASLRTVILAGEACPAVLVQAHHQSLPGVRLFNEYGPTEATVWSTAQELTPADAEEPVPIGRPIPRMRAYVLDEERRPVPAGVPGELWLAGAGLSSGYRNLDRETGERFMQLDVAGSPERAYRTGDLAAWRADGTLVFLGRADQQLKLRGHRVEPAGIEAVLREHRDVADAAVALRGTPGRLVAYVVLVTADAVDAATLQRHLQALLADFLVPETFVFLPSLPRTWSGKIDYKALPEPTSPGAEIEPAAPRDEIEVTLAGIWREVLGVERVGIHDNYFALGGDSILSIQIVSRVRAAGLRIDPRHVLERPTIAELAAAIDSDAGPRPAQTPVAGEVPLSPVQAWFLSRGLAAPHHWNQSVLFEVPAELDVERLRRALACLLAQHDQLRAHFEPDAPGHWRQVVEPPGSVTLPLQVETCGDTPSAESEAWLEARLLEVQGDLDLGVAPLLRALLIRRGPAEPALLLLAVHHLVVDAVSWGVLIEDLEAAYAQAATRLQPRLPARTVSFRDWAGTLETTLAATPPDEAIAPWRQILEADARDLHLDVRPASQPTEADSRTHRLVLPAALTDALLTRANERHATRPEELLLAALTLAVGAAGGGASLRLMREGHGRDGEFDLSRTVGWFTAMTPLAIRLDAIDDPAAVIRTARDAVRAAPPPGQSFGFWRWGGHDPAAAASLDSLGDPLLLFNFLGRRTPVGDGAVFRPVPGAEATGRSRLSARSHLLELNVAVIDDRLAVDWIFCEPVHARATIEGWARRFERELETLVGHCLEDAPAAATTAFPEAELDEEDLGRLMARLNP